MDDRKRKRRTHKEQENFLLDLWGFVRWVLQSNLSAKEKKEMLCETVVHDVNEFMETDFHDGFSPRCSDHRRYLPISQLQRYKQV